MIMFRVNNKKAVRRIADKSFWDNKTRNIIAVIAIALTSILFTTVFTIGSGMVENLQRQTMRQAGGDGMGVLKYITDEEYEKVKGHALIEEISYNRILSDSVENEELLKRHGELYYMDDTGIKLGFCEPVEGHKPEAENEIMMDTKAIQLLGIEKAVGAPVTLELIIHGKEVRRDFVLSGWWEADPIFNVSILVTSREYMEAHMDELYKNYGSGSESEPDRNSDAAQSWDMTGAINSYIMFRNSWGLEDKMERVIVESGFSTDENADNYIESNVNWSYISGSFGSDPVTVAGIAMALLLIVFTGYLIIYNIFQISVVKDIRFYGLLKTIGTTGRQIKKIIRRQAFVLSMVGIPAGLVAGYVVGCLLVPVVMETMIVGGDGVMAEVSASPLIFAGSALFSLITVAISTARPGRIAAKVSPVEAVRYTEGMEGSRSAGRRKYGNMRKKKIVFRSKIFSMAAANFGRDRKRTFLVLLSISLSVVLFHAVYTFSIGFDMDKFLSRFVKTDFLAAHAAYFNYQYSGIDTSVPESMIEAMMGREGFEEGGRIYANIRDSEFFTVDPVEGSRNAYSETELEDGTAPCAVYGMEDFPLEKLEIVEGEIDMEKLKTGKYILEGLSCDDDGNPLPEASHYAIGDKAVLHNYRGESDIRMENQLTDYEFEVMAKVKVETYTNSCGIGYNYNFYLPAEIYKEMVSRPAVMSYLCNVSPEGEEGMEAFLKRYTEEEASEMSYTSKGKRVAEFQGVRNMVLLIGGILSFIMGLIGILNFINSMLTSIIARRREFAILCSIGMTGRQLRRMLIMEGLLYTISAGIVALLLGTGLSFSVMRQLLSVVWFFSYRFTLLPFLGIFPILLLAGMLIPVTAIHFWVKSTDIINNI